ncbi:hypothetical protein [Alteribacter aurantiacus]|uniref:hypothetical protein n=1 Tax=Alteribacter aurantiacus TaxID=254410 RepID=UPI00040B4934|nr:hypothetical protein [Alteribacter aurantiacus]
MGYVPPAMDEQRLVYASRQSQCTPLIYNVPKPERVDPIRSRNHFERQVENMERRKQMIAQLTGKGQQFDQSR